MSLIEQYIKEIEKDTELSELSIKDVQLKLPAIKHKYAGRLVRTKIHLSGLYNKRNQLKNGVVDQLKEEAPYELSDAVASKMADKHNKIRDINAEIYEQKIIIELLEKAERIFNSMTFDIKNLIDVMKLEVE